jgi:hypothetical protein
MDYLGMAEMPEIYSETMEEGNQGCVAGAPRTVQE